MPSDIRYSLELLPDKKKLFFLVNGINTLGRHSANTVCFGTDGRIVSKKHAIITIKNASLTISDCNSTNGLYVNGKQVTESELFVHDIIGFGEKGPRMRICTVPALNKKDADPQPKNTRQGLPSTLKETFAPSEKTFINEAVGDTGASLHSENAHATWDAISLPVIENTAETLSKLRKDKQAITTKEVEKIVTGKSKGNRTPASGSRKTTQEIFLEKFHKIYRKKKQTAFLFFGGVIILLIGILLYYVHGYYRYERTFSQTVKLREESRLADRKIEQLRHRPAADSGERKQLITLLLERERKIDSLMARLPLRYRQRFFSDPVEQYLYEIMTSFNEQSYTFPAHAVQSVREYVDKFKNEYRRDRRLLQQWHTVYFPYIRQTFSERYIPDILAYIAIQESLLDTNALSHAGARGLWQFMPATGKNYGLRINKKNDERIHWRKATVAAARYLHALLTEFGDGRAVLLAIAAYNAGGTKIRQALKEIRDPLRDRDFWYLYRTSTVLPDETREYVPQVLARMVIDLYRDEFGL